MVGGRYIIADGESDATAAADGRIGQTQNGERGLRILGRSPLGLQLGESDIGFRF